MRLRVADVVHNPLWRVGGVGADSGEVGPLVHHAPRPAGSRSAAPRPAWHGPAARRPCAAVGSVAFHAIRFKDSPTRGKLGRHVRPSGDLPAARPTWIA